MELETVFEPETRAFLEGGCALSVGTVSREGEPHATRAWGVEVVDDGGNTLRVMLPAHDASGLDHLTTAGPVAITAADVFTLRAMQLKGRAVGVEPATAEDEARVERFCNQFFGNVEAADGTSRDLLDRMVPSGYVVATVEIEDSFDQTPGPGAGAPLGSART